MLNIYYTQDGPSTWFRKLLLVMHPYGSHMSGTNRGTGTQRAKRTDVVRWIDMIGYRKIYRDTQPNGKVSHTTLGVTQVYDGCTRSMRS